MGKYPLVYLRPMRYLLPFLCLLSLAASAQSDSLEIPLSSTREDHIVFSPVIYYSPETNWAFGAGCIYTFSYPAHPNNNPGLIKALGVYTLEKQIDSELGGDLYFKDNTYYLSFNLSYDKFPGLFYGIGNDNPRNAVESYTINKPFARIDVNRRVKGNLSLGIKTFYEFTRLAAFEEGGLFDTEEVEGELGGHNTGLGPWLWYDNRDNIFYPTKGWKVDISSVFHGRWLGGQYDYLEQKVEVSTFINTYKRQVFALNLLVRLNPGQPPFKRMALMGGQDYMRGNFEGRLRDKHYTTTQAEYRLPIWRFIGSTFFVGAGQVAPDMESFALDQLRLSYGGGLRLRLLTSSNLTMRIDYGIGYDGDHGLYLQFNEAF